MRKIKSAVAAVAVCAGLLVVGGAGGAVADQLLPENSVGTKQVKDRSIRRKDLNVHVAGKYRTLSQIRRLRQDITKLELLNKQHEVHRLNIRQLALETRRLRDRVSALEQVQD